VHTREFKPLRAWRRAALGHVLKRFWPAVIIAVGIPAYVWYFGVWKVWVHALLMVVVVASVCGAALKRRRPEECRIYLAADTITIHKPIVDDLHLRRDDIKAIIDQPGSGLLLVGEHGPLRTVPEQLEGYQELRAVLDSWRPITVPKTERMTVAALLNLATSSLMCLLFSGDPRDFVLRLVFRIYRSWSRGLLFPDE
jgi:hypothetical protein